MGAKLQFYFDLRKRLRVFLILNQYKITQIIVTLQSLIRDVYKTFEIFNE